MLGIVWLWTATVAWLFVIPRIVPGYAAGGLSPGVSAFGAIAAIIVVASPTMRRLDVRWILMLLLLLFFAADRILIGEAVGGVALQQFLGLVYVGGAVLLATRLGRKMVSLEEALEELGAGSEHEQADSFEQGQEDIYREVRRARRYDHPATLMALSVSGVDASVGCLVQEMQREVTEKYACARVAKLLLHETHAEAVVTWRNDHFVVLLPHTGAVGARHVAERLAATATERWGLEVRSGIATLPEQEVTFSGLLERAESALRTVEGAAATDPAREYRGRPLSERFREADPAA